MAPKPLPFPNFTSPVTFPPFTALPQTSSPPSSLSTPYFLLGTIKENMTLSQNPTYILTDSHGQDFACVLRMTNTSEPTPPLFDVQGFRKGHTVVVRDALRSGVVGEKQGYVGTAVEEVKIIPTSVERLMEMSIKARTQHVQTEGQNLCQACGKQGGEGLLRCKGCEGVWYCNKDCQTKGWSSGHKSECKVLKMVKSLELGDRGLSEE